MSFATRPRHPRTRAAEDPPAENPPIESSQPNYTSRSWIWDNGSVLCDRWLKFESCTRLNCTHLHRQAKEGEIRPICWNHFVNKDPCCSGPMCPLSHESHGCVPGRKDYRKPPIEEDSDDDRILAPLKSAYDNPLLKAGLGKKAPTLGSKIWTKTTNPRPNTNPGTESLEGPTVSTPFVPPPPAHHRKRRVKPRGNANKLIKEEPAPSQSPQTIQAPPEPAKTNLKGRKKQNSHEPSLKPLTVAGLYQTSRDNSNNSSQTGGESQPETVQGLSQAAKAKIKRGKSVENLMAKSRASAPKPVFVTSPGASPKRSNAKAVTPRNVPDSSTGIIKPVADRQSIFNDSNFKDDTTISGSISSGCSSPCGGVRLSLYSSTTVGSPFYHQFREVSLQKKILEFDESDSGDEEESVARVEFDSLISNIKTVSEADKPLEPASRVCTPTPLAQQKLPIRPLAKTEKPFEAGSIRGIPEWELNRCFNCFQEGHFPINCPEIYRNILEREQFRNSKGIINRKWTEIVLNTFGLDSELMERHRNIQSIWRPYTSKVTGKFVTPRGFSFRGPQRDLRPVDIGTQPESRHQGTGIKINDPEPSNQDVQTSDSPSPTDSSPATDSPSPKDSPPPNDQPTQTNPRRHQRKRGPDEAPPTSSSPSGSSSIGPTPTHTPPSGVSSDEAKGINEKCWTCERRHASASCGVGISPRDIITEGKGWQHVEWTATDLKDAAPLPKVHALTRQNPKERTLRGGRPFMMYKSSLLGPETTIYRVENGDRIKEIVFDRHDLTLLGKLDQDAKRGRSSSTNDFDRESEDFREAIVDSSFLTRCPNEIIETIMAFTADEYAYDRNAKVKDVTSGGNYRVDNSLQDNVRRAHNLSGAVKTCRQLRLISQRIIYRFISIDNYKSFHRLARTLTASPDLGKMVHVLRVHLEHSPQSYTNRGLFKYQMQKTNSPTKYDQASLLVRVLERCFSIQVLAVRMGGAFNGFATIKGRWKYMRDISISDPASSGQVMNQMWNHLVSFPRLTKYKIVHSEMNAAVDFEPFEIPFHMADRALDSTFTHLRYICLENSPEVSDDLLHLVVRRMPLMNKLTIINCKLVTSGGIAQALEHIPQKLKTLIFWIWLDPSGRPTPKEISTPNHLCSALKDHSESIVTLNLKPYKLCEEMWKDAHYENLSRCSIEMMQFCHCHNTLNPKDETGFRTAFEKAKEEGRTPALDNAVLYLQSPGISFH